MATQTIRLHHYRPDPLAKLTERQREIVELVAGDPPRRDREVAQTLGISPNTIKVHMANIRDTLRIRSRMDLIQMVERNRAYSEAMGE